MNAAGEWIDPPPNMRGRVTPAYLEAAELAKTRPGQWLKLPGTHSSGTTAQMRKGMCTVFKSIGEWEFTQRKVEDGSGRAYIWIRYMGPSGKGPK